ncbi:MAG: hypothetical protein ACRC5F_07780, partial [Cetobacterium sp.]
AFILALHSGEPSLSFLFIGLNTVFYYLYFTNFDYNIGNVYLLSLLQIIAWKFYVNIPLIPIDIMINSIFYFVINLLYMRRATK